MGRPRAVARRDPIQPPRQEKVPKRLACSPPSPFPGVAEGFPRADTHPPANPLRTLGQRQGKAEATRLRPPGDPGHPSTRGPSARPGRSASPPPRGKHSSPAGPHTPRNFPRACAAAQPPESAGGQETRAEGCGRGGARRQGGCPAPRERAGLMEPLAWAPRLPPGDPHLPSLLLWEATPASPATGAAEGGEGLAGGSQPPRPTTAGNAVGVRGTIGSGERRAPEWRRRPAGLTDAPAARHDWAPLGRAAAAAARSAGVTAPPALRVVPHLPAPLPRRGAELTLSATPSSAAAASSRVNSSTSIRREQLKGLGPETPREAGTSPRPEKRRSTSLSLHFRGPTGSQLLQNRDLPPARSFPSSLPRFPSLAPFLFPISLPQARDLRLLPHHVMHGRPMGTRSRAPSSAPPPPRGVPGPRACAQRPVLWRPGPPPLPVRRRRAGIGLGRRGSLWSRPTAGALSADRAPLVLTAAENCQLG